MASELPFSNNQSHNVAQKEANAPTFDSRYPSTSAEIAR